MKKREFIKLTLLGIGTLSLPEKLFSAASIPTNRIFNLPITHYRYEAVMPCIDAESMQFHSLLFQDYTVRLNEAVKRIQYTCVDIEDVLRKIDASDLGLRNNGGGYFNHSLYFKIMSPEPQRKPVGKLRDMIDANFGSLEGLQENFLKMATGIFGSGWIWLTAIGQDKLAVVHTSNNDNPLMSFSAVDGYPLLCIDMWEHAYYLTFQSNIEDYVNSFWKVMDWHYVEQRYKHYIKSSLKL